jgi:hypothetical protein
MINLTDWKEGNPPHVGWWLSNNRFTLNIWRWWDGENWSVAVQDNEPVEVAAEKSALISGFYNEDIYWTDYYPENARVPRVAP